jgi:hypothetical protein
MEIKKLFAIGIIFLFIGVAVAPSINSSVVNPSDDLVEVTSQACGIQGFGNTTVKLTKAQYQNLENYLVDFRARLNQTTTREEAVPLFKDAVMELDKYGLLPKRMSIEQAQKLVLGINSCKFKILQKIFDKYYKEGNDNYTNTLCLVIGLVGFAFFWSILAIVAGMFYSLGIWAAFPIFFYCHIVKPVMLISIIRLFGDQEGEIYSIGLLGFKYLTGYISGTILGFTGLRIAIPVPYNSPANFFIGTGIHMSIYEE